MQNTRSLIQETYESYANHLTTHIPHIYAMISMFLCLYYILHVYVLGTNLNIFLTKLDSHFSIENSKSKLM